jgi:hypothetical protein
LYQNNRAQCLQQGWTWITDPNPDPQVAAAIGAGNIGTCVDPAVASAPGFNPANYFANITFAASGNPPTLPLPSTAVVSTGQVSPPPPPSSYGSAMQSCSTFDLIVDQNRFLAVAALVGIFAWLGGFR